MPPVPSRQALRYLSGLCRPSRYNSNELLRALPIRYTATRCSKTTIQSRNISTTQIRHNDSQVQDRTATRQPNANTTATLPDITNYYTLFPKTLPSGPPSQSNKASKFDISVAELRREFLRLQSIHHPDKYDPSTPAHQKALALSSFINNAFKTLSDPLLRAQYLLQLEYDVDVTSEDNAAHPTDQETLMEVMDAQERIEEAQEQVEIDQLKDENQERISQTVAKMGRAFEDGNVDAAKNECVRLKYWRSLQQGLHDWEPGKEVRLIH